MSQDEFAPVTPGEMLKDEFLTEYRPFQSRMAKAVGISPNRIAEIINNRRRITANGTKTGLVFWKLSGVLEEPPDQLRSEKWRVGT